MSASRTWRAPLAPSALALLLAAAGCSTGSGGAPRLDDLATGRADGGPADLAPRDLATATGDLAARPDLAAAPADLARPAGDMCALLDGGVPLPFCGPPDFGLPGFDGGLPGFDIGLPAFDIGLPGFDIGIPVNCGQIPCFGNVQICKQLGCSMCAGNMCAK